MHAHFDPPARHDLWAQGHPCPELDLLWTLHGEAAR
jgi:hypothetical protein